MSNVLAIATPFVAAWEGCRLEAYRDAAGFPTQGYGRLISRDRHIELDKIPRITQSLAEQWLAEDLARTLAGVLAALDGHGPWSDHELAAMTSLAFNIGLSAFRHATVCRMLTTCDPPNRALAADAFRLWNKITDPDTGRKAVSKGLAGRREAERTLFLTPD